MVVTLHDSQPNTAVGLVALANSMLLVVAVVHEGGGECVVVRGPRLVN